MDSERLLFNPELIKPDDQQYQPLLQNLQGNILKGHGRRFTRQIFMIFKEKKQSQIKQAIADLAQESTQQNWWEDIRVTSAMNQQRQAELRSTIENSLFCNFFLSAKGYEFLGIEPPEDSSFHIGMAESLQWPSYVSPSVIKKLNQGSKATKQAVHDSFKKGKMAKGHRNEVFSQEIHAMILLANNDQTLLDAAEQQLKSLYSKLVSLFHVESGKTISAPENSPYGKSVEHFGYSDGISNPLFYQKDYDKALQKEHPPAFDQYDPRASLTLVLVKDPHGGEAAYGSYLVFQKLEQNVEEFSKQITNLANALNIGEELAEAFVMGRFKDGTPVVESSRSGMSSPRNNFSYYQNETDHDNAGMRCPLHAHIRKVNPRRGRYRDNRIVRRGITYDDRQQPDDKTPPHKNVGILFMCFQSDIGNQYETLVKDWAFDGTPRAESGTDPILSFNSDSHYDQNSSEAQSWPERWGGMKPLHKKLRFPFEQVIKNLGGEYFFAPSLSFLRKLPNLH